MRWQKICESARNQQKTVFGNFRGQKVRLRILSGDSNNTLAPELFGCGSEISLILVLVEPKRSSDEKVMPFYWTLLKTDSDGISNTRSTRDRSEIFLLFYFSFFFSLSFFSVFFYLFSLFFYDG